MAELHLAGSARHLRHAAQPREFARTKWASPAHPQLVVVGLHLAVRQDGRTPVRLDDPFQIEIRSGSLRSGIGDEMEWRPRPVAILQTVSAFAGDLNIFRNAGPIEGFCLSCSGQT